MNVLSMFRPTPTDDLAAQRQRRALALARTCLLEVDRDHLSFGPFGAITHRDGHQYRAVRGIVEEPTQSSATAFYLTPTDAVIYLEPLRP